jgi:DNA-binding MarR family transcriptional regulator
MGVYTRVMATSPEDLDRACSEAAGSCACFHLRRAARAVTQLYDDRLRPCGLRVTQFALLVAVRNRGPLPVSGLAELTLVDRTTLTRNLALLARKGLLRLDPGEDRRVRDVRITDLGRRALVAAIPLWRGAQREMVRRLGSKRLGGLLAGLAAAAAAARGGGGTPHGRRSSR